MRVLYVSKAMTVGAYRDKLRELARHVELRALAPERWAGRKADSVDGGQPWMQLVRAAFDGHNHFHLYRDVHQLFEGGRPDIVHIDEEPYSAVTAQLARQCSRRNLPFLFFAWQNIEKRIPPPFDAVRSYVFKRASAGLAGTEEAAGVLRAWGWRGLTGVIPQMGVDPDRFQRQAAGRQRVRQLLNVGPSDFVIGFGGRLLREKGVHTLVRAAGMIPGALLVFVGDGPERASILETAQATGIAHRVQVRPGVPSQEVPDWLSAFDVLVLPSLTTRGWKEQFGRILVEAMACEVAVIGSDSGEIPTVVGDGGIVVREGDVLALADALRKVAGSHELRAELGARGRKRVISNYTNERIAIDTVRFYEQLLAEVAA